MTKPLGTNYRQGLSEIISIVVPGAAQLSQMMESKIAKFSKPMQDEVYGRFHSVYKKTMDPVKGLELLRDNNESDILQDKFFEVVTDVETSNTIMMKFKQGLPRKEILEAYAGLSDKGKERISSQLQKNIRDAKNNELEAAFETVFGKMDPWAHRARHLFVLKNIQDENRGLSYVKEHLSHLDPIFAKDMKRILKNELHCSPKTADAKAYSDAAKILIKDLQSSKKSSSSENTTEKDRPKIQEEVSSLSSSKSKVTVEPIRLCRSSSIN